MSEGASTNVSGRDTRQRKLLHANIEGNKRYNMATVSSLNIHTTVKFPPTEEESPTQSKVQSPSPPENRGFRGKNIIRKPARPGSASSGGSRGQRH
jgi:hypothetical protein